MEVQDWLTKTKSKLSLKDFLRLYNRALNESKPKKEEEEW